MPLPKHRDPVKALSQGEIDEAVRRALDEDLGDGDVTTSATVPPNSIATALMATREPIRVAGLQLAESAFRQLDPGIKIELLAKDGGHVLDETALLKVTGRAQALLSAERVALNFLQRLCGVATLTAEFVRRIAGTRAQVLDTRKTTPGWRRFEKY